MVTSTKAQIPECRVMVNGVPVEKLHKFKYLCIWITSGGRSEIDVNCRVSLVMKIFMNMRNVMCVRKLGMGGRKYLLRCYIWSMQLYGCES